MQGAGHAVERGVSADAYASVGGLDKQIAQIRDLIEIPLTRPELFRQFGASSLGMHKGNGHVS